MSVHDKILLVLNSAENNVYCVYLLLYLIQLQTDRGSNSTEKFPSFELVLNFVGNEALSEEKVRSLLKQREESARAAAQTYGFIADYIEMTDNHGLFEVTWVIIGEAN